jgi:glutamine synthetase
VEGYTRVYESDMVAHPDPATFQMLPWRQGTGTARMFCDISNPDGTPSYADPRYVLKRAMDKASAKGFTFYCHPEIEFYLLTGDHKAGTRPQPLDDGGYFDHTTLGAGTDFRRDSITMLEQMGISVEFSHHEAGPGQHEIDLRYADALTMADNIMTFRVVIREVAALRGISATFMPKPFTEHPGSGMHSHVSLFEGDNNAFFDASDPTRLSTIGKHFVAGVLHHAPEYTAITNQWVNSYRRLNGGGEAPSYICWGRNNRSALVRVPLYKPDKAASARVEVRSIDSAANPYLAYALILAAGPVGHRARDGAARGGLRRRLEAHQPGAAGDGHPPAADQPRRGHPLHGGFRAGRGHPRGARLQLRSAQQEGGVRRVPQPGDAVRAGSLPAESVIRLDC